MGREKEAAATRMHFYPRLEPLRGLAALSVVLIHCIGIFPNVTPHSELGQLVLAAFLKAVNGRNAVVFFFVLSGFVLAESLHGKQLGLKVFLDFILKRFFRIIPVAYFGLVIGAVYMNVILPDEATLHAGAAWFADGFGNVDLHDFIANLLFLSNHINVVYWTLFIEVVASILFIPMLAITRFGWIANVVLCIGLLCVSYQFFEADSLEIGTFTLPLFNFTSYFFCFQLGIIVNQMVKRIEGFAIAPPKSYILASLAIAVGCALIFLAHSEFSVIISLTGFKSQHSADARQTYVEAFGACLVVAAACRGSIADLILTNRLVIHLGRLSFPLYAIHIIILKPVFVCYSQYFAGKFYGPLFTISLVVPLAIGAAQLIHLLIELPSIKFARRLVSKAQGCTVREPADPSRDMIA